MPSSSYSLLNNTNSRPKHLFSINEIANQSIEINSMGIYLGHDIISNPQYTTISPLSISTTISTGISLNNINLITCNNGINISDNACSFTSNNTNNLDINSLSGTLQIECKDGLTLNSTENHIFLIGKEEVNINTTNSSINITSATSINMTAQQVINASTEYNWNDTQGNTSQIASGFISLNDSVNSRSIISSPQYGVSIVNVGDPSTESITVGCSIVAEGFQLSNDFTNNIPNKKMFLSVSSSSSNTLVLTESVNNFNPTFQIDDTTNNLSLTTNSITSSTSLTLNTAIGDFIICNNPLTINDTITTNNITINSTSIVLTDVVSSTTTTIANNVCLLDNNQYDYQLKAKNISLTSSSSCYIHSGVCWMEKGIGYTITGGRFNVYYLLKPLFLPYDNCKYRMNISVQLTNFGGGNQDKENQFYFSLYDPNNDIEIESFVLNSSFPYSTFIGIPQSITQSVMNFSFVDYFDLTPYPSPKDGEYWVRFYGNGNGTTGDLRYFISFDRIEL